MKYTNILTESIFMSIDQAWQNVQFMDKRERKLFIKKIIASNRFTTGCIEYYAKYYLASLIDSSECYFNEVGYSTPVKEFMEIGWYKEAGIRRDGSPVYELDFNKVMGK
jgi:hypothetical protein